MTPPARRPVRTIKAHRPASAQISALTRTNLQVNASRPANFRDRDQSRVTESNGPSSGTAPAVSRETVSVHVENLVHVVAAETCLRRRDARLPGIICRRL